MVQGLSIHGSSEPDSRLEEAWLAWRGAFLLLLSLLRRLQVLHPLRDAREETRQLLLRVLRLGHRLDFINVSVLTVVRSVFDLGYRSSWSFAPGDDVNCLA